ncbi:MAG: hypothetical protein NTX82_05390 [Candidatus Parcubacteria bacterium]|nr:hypothetical protein [Candidatus Parcubacteria bacterium]
MTDPNTTPATDTPTETVIEPKAEEQVYTCACCGHEATAEDGVVTEQVNGKPKIVDATMWAAAGEVGSETVLKVFCKTCATEGKEDDGQTFFPLKNALAYADRVKRHFPKRERLLEQANEPEMRQPRPEMFCKRCGKRHGQIDNYRGGVTVIRRAYRVDFNQKPIIAEFLCGECLTELGLVPKRNSDGSFTQPEGLFPPWKTLQIALHAEDNRLDRIERDKANKARREEQRQRDKELRERAMAPKAAPTTKVFQRPVRHEPLGKAGTGSIGKPANRKDGTRG